MSSDAQIKDLICLKQPPAAPIERWQMIPARRPRQVSDATPVSSPLRVRATNGTINVSVSAKTPDVHKVVLKYKKTHSPKTPKPNASALQRKTPGTCNSSRRRTPAKSGKKKTPGRSPSGCRFIPNRSSMDLEYSAYLLRKECEEERDSDSLSPSRQECQQALLKAISRSRGKSGQRNVLSFSIATPSVSEGTFIFALLYCTFHWLHSGCHLHRHVYTFTGLKRGLIHAARQR